MNPNFKTILSMALSLLFLFTIVVPCFATEKEEQDFWSEDSPRWQRGRFELTEEKIERIMSWLEESEPEMARKLKQLREDDTEKFKAELRDVVREKIHRQMSERMEQRADEMPQPHGPGMATGPEGILGILGGPHREKMIERLRERHEEYIEWLEKNYPEKAKELNELKEQNPELYMRRLGLGMRKYRRILWASRENPELAEVLKKDMELKQQRDELIRKIGATTEDEEKKELTAELEKVVSERFDLIVKRKQIEYEHLLKKLEKLKQEIKTRETEVKKWKDADFKSKNVKNRVEQLISKTEEINWD